MFAAGLAANQVIIINKTMLDKMTVSAVLKKLVSLGFVERKEDTHNTEFFTVESNSAQKTMLKALSELADQRA